MNNLSYLKNQIKGYDIDETDENTNEDENPENDDENIVFKLLSNGSMVFETNRKPNTSFAISNANSNAEANASLDLISSSGSSSNSDVGSASAAASTSSFSSSGSEFESSGDGEELDDQHLENKSGYIALADSEKLVSSQLQRLTHLINIAQKRPTPSPTPNPTPDDLNQFLTMYHLNADEFHSRNPNAEPVPQNTLIADDHLQQILQLQKKLNDLANTRNSYSTTPAPMKFTVASGFYPAEATTLHIKATNALENVQYPKPGPYASSQIVVNRPGGSVVFRLPNPNVMQNSDDTQHHQQISTDTLKMILELSKKMSNNAPNTPHFVHSMPESEKYVQPMVQPILYNFPWNQLALPSLMGLLNSMKSKEATNEQESMEKISSVSGSLSTDSNMGTEQGDAGPTTIIHNHMPITVAHPNPTNSLVNRIQVVSTTQRPMADDRYDSYGNKRPHEYTNLSDYYPPYSTLSETIQKKPAVQQLSVVDPAATYSSPFATHHSNYGENSGHQQQYIQIAQSQPDHYIPEYANNMILQNAMGSMRPMRPIPTFASIDGSYTKRFYPTYTPQPHLNDENVNKFVRIHQSSYPTLKPMNYVPIATASSPTPSYAKPSDSFNQIKEHTSIFDTFHRFASSKKRNEMDSGESNNVNQFEDNQDYAESNLEQMSEDRSDEENDGNSNSNSNSDSGSSDENMMTLLASVKSNSNTENSMQKKPSHQDDAVHIQNHNSKHKQFVSLNGNFMTMETYQQAIEPYLDKESQNDLQIEVMTCATGIRQANTSDCTRYFVCNEKTGRILSYNCPPYTAFNADIRICNGDTYSQCVLGGDSKTPTIGGNAIKKLEQSIIKANRFQAEAEKSQQLAQLIKLEAQKLLVSAPQTRHKQKIGHSSKATPKMVPPTRPVKAALWPTRKSHGNNAIMAKPHKQSGQSAAQQQINNKFRGKRKIPCKQEGKLADNLSIHHYFLCFKDLTETMRARRLQCPANLIFCPSIRVCTATERCSSKLNGR